MLKEAHRTNMSQQVQNGWRGFPSYKIITVSRTCSAQSGYGGSSEFLSFPITPPLGMQMTNPLSEMIFGICWGTLGGLIGPCAPSIQLTLGGGGCLPGDTIDNTRLCLLVWHQQNLCQICCAIWAPDALSLSGLVWWPFPNHPLHVFPIRAMARNLEFKTHYHSCIPQIFSQSQPVKHPCQDIKQPLEPLWLYRRDKAIICVEKGGNVMHRADKPL